MSDQNLLCSFCGLSKTQTNLLVAGQEAHICDSCIEQAYNIIIEESKRDESTKQSQDHKISKPKEIKAFLDEYVIGQDYTKKIIYTTKRQGLLSIVLYKNKYLHYYEQFPSPHRRRSAS